MTERTDLLASIANTIKDYRSGEIAQPTPDHVDRWVKQFDAAAQILILRETNHVLAKTYFSLDKVTRFLTHLVTNKKLAGDNHCAFWSSVRFLDIQQGGNSQRELLALFDEILKRDCAVSVSNCGANPGAFVYVDDALFTGNRIRRDLENWIRSDAPAACNLHVITIATHIGGRNYARDRINLCAKEAGKTVSITWWAAIELEDRKSSTDTSDVLRPASIPDVADVKDYVAGMTHTQVLRRPGSVGSKAIFSTEDSRNLLEQEFLKTGARIRKMCPNLGATQRPLGHMTLDTLGFGSLIVTFRNCPNNVPLALWVGDPWYPLFPRTTNSQTAIQRLFAEMIHGGVT